MVRNQLVQVSFVIDHHWSITNPSLTSYLPHDRLIVKLSFISHEFISLYIFYSPIVNISFACYQPMTHQTLTYPRYRDTDLRVAHRRWRSGPWRWSSACCRDICSSSGSAAAAPGGGCGWRWTRNGLVAGDVGLVLVDVELVLVDVGFMGWVGGLRVCVKKANRGKV